MTSALIALNACAQNPTGHLQSNGLSDSVIDFSNTPAADLASLNNNALMERLGKPEIARYEQGIYYWRYATVNCLLDVYLSLDQASGDLHVEHMAVRAKAGSGSYACPAPPDPKELDIQEH